MLKGNSRSADKFVLRMPDGMRGKISEIAGNNNRSMNSEILIRLNASIADSNSFRGWRPVIGMLVVYKDELYQIGRFTTVNGKVGAVLRDFHEGRDKLATLNELTPYEVDGEG